MRDQTSSTPVSNAVVTLESKISESEHHVRTKTGGDNRFAFAISLSYPVSDIVVGALALLLISRLVTDRLPMALLSGGLIAMGMAGIHFGALSFSDLPASFHTPCALRALATSGGI